jgi:hypothetical protein
MRSNNKHVDHEIREESLHCGLILDHELLGVWYGACSGGLAQRSFFPYLAGLLKYRSKELAGTLPEACGRFPAFA